MKKKRDKSPLFLNPFGLGTFVLGIFCGIASQNIPQSLAYVETIDPTHKYSKHNIDSTSLSIHPKSVFYIYRHGYTLTYDARHRNPLWVYEHLTSESVKGEVERQHSEFKEDESIPKHLRATLADYKGQGFDRGHMAPAANHRSTIQGMDDTFFMTNMCPQCPQLNRGYWSKLERHVRNLTKDYENIHVFTGPLYLPNMEENGKRYIKYQVIGKNDIAVPTHFFKVIVLEDWQQKKEMQAYILPNQEISASIPLENFRSTVQKVEKAAGLIFLSP